MGAKKSRLLFDLIDNDGNMDINGIVIEINDSPFELIGIVDGKAKKERIEKKGIKTKKVNKAKDQDNLKSAIGYVLKANTEISTETFTTEILKVIQKISTGYISGLSNYKNLAFWFYDHNVNDELFTNIKEQEENSRFVPRYGITRNYSKYDYDKIIQIISNNTNIANKLNTKTNIIVCLNEEYYKI